MAESPAWKKPSDVMRIHRRKSLLSSKAGSFKCQKNTPQNSLAMTGDIVVSQSSLKRKNPFSSTIAPIKRLSVDDMSFRSESSENSSTDGVHGIPLTESSQGIALFKCLTESDAGVRRWHNFWALILLVLGPNAWVLSQCLNRCLILVFISVCDPNIGGCHRGCSCEWIIKC